MLTRSCAQMRFGISITGQVQSEEELSCRATPKHLAVPRKWPDASEYLSMTCLTNLKPRRVRFSVRENRSMLDPRALKRALKRTLRKLSTHSPVLRGEG